MTNYDFTIRYNVTGEERKRLVDYIAGFLGCDKQYLGAPSFAYRVGYIDVSRDGTITFDSRADSEEIETLLAELESEGFRAESADDSAAGAVESESDIAHHKPDSAAEAVEAGIDATEDESGEQGAPVGLTVEIPLDQVALGNLMRLLDAKGNLIRKALGVTDLSIEIGETTVKFPWFEELPGADQVNAYTHLITALCELSKNQKRITATEKEVENEKYAFRCFLLRLGFIGAEYKAERKILLRNFTGSSAFKCGHRKKVAEDEISE